MEQYDDFFPIYLSGSIRKGDNDDRPDADFWLLEHEEYICSNIPDALLLNPSKTNISRNDYFINFGCDLFLLQSSKVVLVDLRTPKGIGVGAELMYARTKDIPVVGWCPHGSSYKKSRLENVFGEDLENWIHPFAYGLTDFLVDSLFEAVTTLKRIRASGRLQKDPDKEPNKAISEYIQRYTDDIGYGKR